METVKESTISVLNAEELACKVVGLDYDKIDADEFLIEEALEEEFYIDLHHFTKIVNRLIPLINVAQSPLTEKWYKGFADMENKTWIVKEEI